MQTLISYLAQTPYLQTMVSALGKQSLEPIHTLLKRLMLKLDKREDFIPKSNSLASGEVSLREDINKRIPWFNRTNLKLHVLASSLRANGMNFILTRSFDTLDM